MNTNPNDSKRRAIPYSNDEISDEYIADTLHCGPFYYTLSGAERKTTASLTNAAVPSDDAVEEMRDWSIESEL